MSNESVCWRRVALGLQLKLIALWFVMALPIVALAAWYFSWSIAYPLVIVLVSAILIDVSGRCCCLATPMERHWPLIFSVGAQLAAVTAAAMFFIGLAEVNLLVSQFFALSILLCGQAIAAFLFTRYLADLAMQSGRTDLVELARGVKRGLVQNVLAGSGMMLAVMILGVVVAALCLFSAGILWPLAIPLGAIVLLPLLLLWTGVALQMFGKYGRVLRQLRATILAKSIEHLTTTTMYVEH